MKDDILQKAKELKSLIENFNGDLESFTQQDANELNKAFVVLDNFLSEFFPEEEDDELEDDELEDDELEDDELEDDE